MCAAVLLAPGAGADRNQSSLVAIDAALTAAGLTVARMDFPYRKAGRRAPDRPPVLLQAAVEEAAALATVAGCAPAQVALGAGPWGVASARWRSVRGWPRPRWS